MRPQKANLQSAPALLLTCDDDARASPNTSTTSYAPHNPTSNPSTHSSTHPSSESAAKNKVNTHPGFEYKLHGFSPSTDRADTVSTDSTVFDDDEKREKALLSIHTVSEDWNNDDFDALTTGDSSLCGSSSRRSAAPSRSSHRSSSHHHNYYQDRQEQGRYSRPSSRATHQSSSDKVSTYSDDTYTTRSSHTDTARSTSSYARRSYSSGRDRSHRRDGAGTTTTHTTRTTHTTDHTYTTTQTTTTHSTSRRRSSSSGQVSSARDTTSNMYSSVYSTTSAGAGVSDRCPTPPRSTPPLVRSKVSGNEYSDSSYTDLATSPAHTVHTSSYPSYTSSTYTVRTAHSTKTLPTTKPVNFRYHRSGHYCDLPLEWWERTEHCKEAKLRHTDRIDHMCGSRESLVLKTTLWKDDIVLEPNMFPYYTPYGVEHYTLWSIDDMSHQQIVSFVDRWLYRHMPQVRRWQYDDNSGERSIDLFHVHVFIETAPYTYAPREGMLYVPPHAVLEDQDREGVRDGGSAESAIVL